MLKHTKPQFCDSGLNGQIITLCYVVIDRKLVPCWPPHEWNTWQVRCYDSGTDESSTVGHAACTASSELIHQSANKQQNIHTLFMSPHTLYTMKQHDEC
jgi:hypothetical protein